MSHKKFGPDRFSRFGVYWIQTNKHHDRQAKFIYRWRTLLRSCERKQKRCFLRIVMNRIMILIIYFIKNVNFLRMNLVLSFLCEIIWFLSRKDSGNQPWFVCCSQVGMDRFHLFLKNDRFVFKTTKKIRNGRF